MMSFGDVGTVLIIPEWTVAGKPAPKENGTPKPDD